MNTVMARYRELGSNLEASAQVQKEAQEAGQQHWHILYERCWCGYLTVPSMYYEHDKEGRQITSQADAEKAYRAANKISLQALANTNLQTCECGNPTRPRGTDCWKCYRERSRG